MTPLNPIFALLVFGIGFLTTCLIGQRKQAVKSVANRYDTLDGLRGFLAISVFIHHTTVWYGYLQTGTWSEPGSNLYNQLGQSSVALFFMISSFLFIGKLLNFSGEEYDWRGFFTGRFFRIVPLYLLSFSLVVLTVGILSEWTLQVSIFDFLKNLIRWAGLGILGQPDLNGVDYTTTINSFVNWSLLYEWLLYFSLPLIAIFILKTKPRIYYILLGILFIAFAMRYRDLKLEHLSSLLGGAVVAVIDKFQNFKINFNHIVFTLITIVVLVLVVQFRDSGNWICKSFLVLAFMFIALGNDLFGLLKNKTLKLMGDISYSTYLLHGILIFIVVHFGLGVAETRLLSGSSYCWVMVALTPILMGVSFMTYAFIEKPFIKYSKSIRKKGVIVNK